MYSHCHPLTYRMYVSISSMYSGSPDSSEATKDFSTTLQGRACVKKLSYYAQDWMRRRGMHDLLSWGSPRSNTMHSFAAVLKKCGIFCVLGRGVPRCLPK